MTQHSEPFLLSEKGSTRATAYGFGNKSVTLDGKTHVVWLDAVARVCGRTYDHASKAWGETLHLFEGCDNHTNPTLAADTEGHLHLAYGPHGWWGNWNQARFNHVVSEKPGSLDGWRDEVSFGYNATYANLVHAPSGVDCIVYRGGDAPWSAMFQKQRPAGGWTSARELMCQDVESQYIHVGATMVCDAARTLHAAAHFYNATAGSSPGAAVLKSVVMGETWATVAGEAISLPIRYGNQIAIPHRGGDDVRLTGLAVDSRGGLWAATSSQDCPQLSHWSGRGWETMDLAPFLPGDRVAQAGPITIDSCDRIHMVTNLNEPVEGKAWGHPSHEVFHLVSRDRGASFECNQVSPADDSTANWLPSISLAGRLQPVDKPVILYTRGDKGEGCLPITETEVYCVFVEDLG